MCLLTSLNKIIESLIFLPIIFFTKLIAFSRTTKTKIITFIIKLLKELNILKIE